MHNPSSISKFFILLVVFLTFLLSGCTSIKHSLYGVALDYENWKAGLDEKTLDWKGRPISYLENSEDSAKEILVMIHGYAANKENWVRFAAYLTDTYHVIAIDLPGHGESVKDMNMSYNWEDQVLHLDDILKQLNISEFHLIGNSMGGGISCLYAVKYPDHVKSLLLIDPAGIDRYECELLRLFKEGKNPFVITCQDDFDQLMDFALEEKPFIPWPIVSVMADKAIENQPINKKILSDIRNEKGFEFEREYKKISVPTLIMWGAQDRLLSVKNANILKELIPNSQTIIFEGVGHAPMLEVPEKAAERYKEFLISMPTLKEKS